MRHALGIEYDGSGFLGWQRHHGGATVQGAVEAALGFVADAPIEVTCAGRTDAGVHAACQVVHFDSDAGRPARAWGARRWRRTFTPATPRAREATVTRSSTGRSLPPCSTIS